MAKDDYNVLVCKILAYYYACFKRKIKWQADVFAKTICKTELNEGYLIDVFRLMQGEGFIDGLTFIKAWGNDYVLTSNLENARITAKGIRYISNDGIMQDILSKLSTGTDLVSGLISLIGLI